MHKIWPLISILVVALFTAACGSDAASSPPTGANVRIVAPVEGSTVSGPIDVLMTAEEFEIEPAGVVREGAGHLHLIIDAGCVAPGASIPADEAHLHFGDGSTTAVLELPPGTHTLCLQAGDGFHTALDLTDTVTFTVTG